MIFTDISDFIASTGQLIPDSFKLENLKIDISHATSTINEYVPNEVLRSLPSEILTPLRTSIALLSLLSYLDSNEVSHTQSGRKIISGADEKTPWQWQVEKDRVNIKNKAYISLSIALNQLQNGNHEDWEKTNFAILQKKSFVNSYTSFSKYYDLGGDYTMYFAILSKIALSHHRLRSFVDRDLYIEYESDTTKDGRYLLEEIVVLETIKKILDNAELSIGKNSITRNFTQPNGNLNSASSVVSSSDIVSFKNRIEQKIRNLISEFNKYYNISPQVVTELPKRLKHGSL